MSKPLISFLYEDVRYFATLDEGFLQQSFPGRNAVSINEIQINAGFSAAVSQPWGAYRPNLCPVSEDAKVVKDGDNFHVTGTCGGYRFELTEISYEIEKMDVEDEDIYAAEETLEGTTEMSEQVEESIKTDTYDETLTDEVASQEEPVTRNDNAEMFIGRKAAGKVQRNAILDDSREAPEAVIVANTVRKPDKYRGIRFGMTLQEDKEVRNLPEKQVTIKETPPVRVVEETVPEGEDTPQVEPVPEEIPLSFDAAPKPSMGDFDCMEFLAALSNEQVSFLQKVPENLLGTIHEFTKETVSEPQLMSLGSIYCVNNKWKISGDWYAIDEIQTLSRCIFCASTNEYQRISTKTLKGWLKCVEAGLVG